MHGNAHLAPNKLAVLSYQPKERHARSVEQSLHTHTHTCYGRSNKCHPIFSRSNSIPTSNRFLFLDTASANSMARCQHSVYILCYHTRQLGIQRQNLLLSMLLSASLNMSERLEHAVAIYQCMCDLHRKCCLLPPPNQLSPALSCPLSLLPVPVTVPFARTQKQNIDIFTSSSFITIHCERNRHKINKSFTRPEPPKIELAVCAFVCAKATLEIAAITRRRHSSLRLIM